jgi:DNA-binding NtrC family response regulator
VPKPGDESTAEGASLPIPDRTAPRGRASVTFYHREGTALLELREQGSAVVGRSFPADLLLPEPSLSRMHARFTFVDGVLTVADLQSKHGTLLAGKPIEESKLESGDELRLGGVSAVVHMLGSPALAGQGVESYDRMLRRLREEVLRAREFGRPLALLMVQARAEPTVHVGQFVAGLGGALRTVDALGIYDDRTAIVVMPELRVEAAHARSLELLATQKSAALVGGLGVYPDVAGSHEELLSLCRHACLSASRDQPLVTAAMSSGNRATAASAVVVSDPSMRALYRVVTQVAARGMPVLITGETGVGKEVVAAALHRESRRSGPLKVINCATIPLQLTESVLFGHERGAFTGAAQRATGLFEDASGGTVFLDEIGELSASAQAALLRVLQEKRITRVGSTREIEIDVRIVAATHRDLDAMVETGAFREDLLYRLNTVTLEIPPLRERSAEIAALAQLFLESAISDWGGSARSFSPDVIALLESYDWPGNVRQLRNVVERAAALCERERIEPIDLPRALRGGESVMPEKLAVATLPPPAEHPQGGAPAAAEPDEAFLKARVRDYEIGLIRDALDKSRGNLKAAAELLQLPLRTLSYKMKTFGLTTRTK